MWNVCQCACGAQLSGDNSYPVRLSQPCASGMPDIPLALIAFLSRLSGFARWLMSVASGRLRLVGLCQLCQLSTVGLVFVCLFMSSSMNSGPDSHDEDKVVIPQWILRI